MKDLQWRSKPDHEVGRHAQLGDYELAWVDGEIGEEEDDVLPLLPHSKTPPPHKAVYVGDLRLPDFKQLLATKGVQVLLSNLSFLFF